MNSRDYYIFLLQYFWFAVIPDSEGHILTLTRTSCPRTVTPVTLGSYPRLMHIRSLNKTFGIGHMTWRSFPEIIATHRRLPPRHRLTWPLNRSPKIRGLKQAVNSKSNQFRNINIEKKNEWKKKQNKTGGFDVNCTLSLILINIYKQGCFLSLQLIGFQHAVVLPDLILQGTEVPRKVHIYTNLC